VKNLNEKIVPFYGSELPRLFKIERRSMDREGQVFRFLDRLLPIGNVLDIGAGSGFTADQLRRSHRFVVPLEPAAQMVDPERPLPWVRGIAQELPFKERAFCAAYATWAYFFPQYRGFGPEGLREADRVVHPKGPIVVVDNAGDDEFCGLFRRDISSGSSWWNERGFDCRILQSSFEFDSMEEAKDLLSFYWEHNGREPGTTVKLKFEFKIAVYLREANDG
jgi:hypothetical protein